jgi:hypothetical protein
MAVDGDDNHTSHSSHCIMALDDGVTTAQKQAKPQDTRLDITVTPMLPAALL